MSYGSERGYSIGFNRRFSPMPVGTGTEYDEILSNSDLLTILTKNYSCTQLYPIDTCLHKNKSEQLI
jgi:hypothetical protein